MAKYEVRVTESIDHLYIVEAESPEEALEAYYKLEDDELVWNDRDGQRSWDKPWDVSPVMIWAQTV